MADPVEGAGASAARLPFEEALEKLESLVERLEDGELPLEEALAAFEEGVRLTRSCAEQLDRAERRIEELVEEGGEWLRRPADVEDEDED
jgi:exodeoxyribonuclease VII small subunit